MSRRFGANRRDFLAAAGALGLAGAGGAYVWRRMEFSERLFNPVKLADFSLPAVDGVEHASGEPARGFGSVDLAQGAALVVMFASWCPPCRREHAMIAELSQRTGVPIYGALYKDKPEAAAEFLRRKGNPFHAVGDDPRGLFARAAGARGVPSTILVRPGPRIALRFEGQIEEADIRDRILPAIKAG